MTKFEYIQFKEIIEQRNFRKNIILRILTTCCSVGTFAFVGLGISQLIVGKGDVSLYTTPAIFLVVISQIFSLFKSSSEGLLKKLKKDFEEGKEIDFSDYEKEIEDDEK